LGLISQKLRRKIKKLNQGIIVVSVLDPSYPPVNNNVYQHGLVEHPPFSSLIFPAVNIPMDGIWSPRSHLAFALILVVVPRREIGSGSIGSTEDRENPGISNYHWDIY